MDSSDALNLTTLPDDIIREIITVSSLQSRLITRKWNHLAGAHVANVKQSLPTINRFRMRIVSYWENGAAHEYWDFKISVSEKYRDNFKGWEYVGFWNSEVCWSWRMASVGAFDRWTFGSTSKLSQLALRMYQGIRELDLWPQIASSKNISSPGVVRPANNHILQCGFERCARYLDAAKISFKTYLGCCSHIEILEFDITCAEGVTMLKKELDGLKVCELSALDMKSFNMGASASLQDLIRMLNAERILLNTDTIFSWSDHGPDVLNFVKEASHMAGSVELVDKKPWNIPSAELRDVWNSRIEGLAKDTNLSITVDATDVEFGFAKARILVKRLRPT